jgi:hypothetical protein
MTRTTSPAETREKYKKDFGDELGAALYAFESRLFQLHRRWRDYDVLYFSKLRVEVLNGFANAFFGRHQQMTFECVIMALARLTDPLRSGRFDNLSIDYIHSLLPLEVRNGLLDCRTAITEKSEFARRWRHKFLAHHDLQHALDQAEAFDPVKWQEIEEAIISINTYIERLHYLTIGSEYRLEISMRSNDIGGAQVLLTRVHQANKARKAHYDRIMSGDIREEDLKGDDDEVLRELRGYRS